MENYFTFKFIGRKYDISGVVLDYNEDWTLIRRCIDYSLDGYTIFKNEKVEHFYSDNEKRATKIILDSLGDILKFIDKKHGLIQLYTRKGDASEGI